MLFHPLLSFFVFNHLSRWNQRTAHEFNDKNYPIELDTDNQAERNKGTLAMSSHFLISLLPPNISASTIYEEFLLVKLKTVPFNSDTDNGRTKQNQGGEWKPK